MNNNKSIAIRASDLHVRIDNVITLSAKVEKEIQQIAETAASLGINTERLANKLDDGTIIHESRSEWIARLKRSVVEIKYDALKDNALTERPEHIKPKNRIGSMFTTIGELIG